MLIIGLAVLLGGLIVTVELTRPQPVGKVDFLRAASGIFLLCFVLFPIYAQFDDMVSVRGTVWDWVLQHPFGDAGFVQAESLALIGYLMMVLGWRLAGGARKLRGVSEQPAFPSDSQVQLVAMILGLAGTLCLVVYTRSIGGVGALILQAAAFRGVDPPVVTSFAFLKTLSPMVMAATLLLFGLRSRRHLEGRRRGALLPAIGFLVASMMVLVHQAGRFPLMVFLVTFPLARIIRRDRIPFVGLGVGGLALIAFVLFGKQLFEAGLSTDNLGERWASVQEDAAEAVRMVAIEFAFPTVTLANATHEVPAVISYRWFVDFPLAALYLIPQRLIGVQHPPTVSMVNSSRFVTDGAIPVDIISLGYFSAGVPGVLLVLLAFGALLAWGERLFPPGTDPVDCFLRAAWILFIAMRVMYGDPQLVWPGGLHLIIATFLLWLLRPRHARPAAGDLSVSAA